MGQWHSLIPPVTNSLMDTAWKAREDNRSKKICGATQSMAGGGSAGGSFILHLDGRCWVTWRGSMEISKDTEK
jgi:hypothetical protein